MSARARSLLHHLRYLLARPRVTSHLKGLLFLLAVAAVVGLLAVRIRAIKRRAAAGADEVMEEWPTGREKDSTRTDRFGDPLPPGAIARLGTTRLRPGTMVRHLCFSPDGKRLLSWASSWGSSLPSRLSIWETATGRQRDGLELPDDYVGQFTWLKDGRVLGLLSRPGSKHLVWDFSAAGAAGSPPVPQPKEGRPPSEDTDRSRAIAPNGELVAVGRGNPVQDGPRWIDLRKLVVGQHVEDLELVRRLGPHAGNCNRLLFSADSRLLVAVTSPLGAWTKIVSVWEVASGKNVAQWTIQGSLQQEGTQDLALSPDGRTLALGLADDTARLLDLVSGRQKHSLTVSTSKRYNTFLIAGSAVAFSPDGKYLIAGGRDSVVRVWETATGRELWARRGNHDRVHALAVSPDGKRIATGGRNDLIVLWDTATGTDACPLDGHDDSVIHAAVAPSGQRAVVITQGRNQQFFVWDTATGRLLHHFDIGLRYLQWPTLTPDGRNLLGVRKDRLELYDAATGAAAPLPGRLADYPCTQAALATDGKTLALLSGRHALICEWPTGRLLQRFEVRPDAPVSAGMYCEGLSLSADGRRLLVLTDFGPARTGRPCHLAARRTSGTPPRAGPWAALLPCEAILPLASSSPMGTGPCSRPERWGWRARAMPGGPRDRSFPSTCPRAECGRCSSRPRQRKRTSISRSIPSPAPPMAGSWPVP